MNTLEIAVLIYFGLSLKVALAAVALINIRSLKRSSANGARGLKRNSSELKESARREKKKSQPVLSSSGRGIRKQSSSSGEKPFEPVTAGKELPLEARKTGKAASPEGVGPSSMSNKMKGITPSTRNKAEEQADLFEVPKQTRPDNTAPVGGSEPSGTFKDDSVKHTAILGAPQPQLAFTVSRSGQKPTHVPSPGDTGGEKKDEMSGTVEPAKTNIKEGEDRMDIEPDASDNQASSEPPEASADSEEAGQETEQ